MPGLMEAIPEVTIEGSHRQMGEAHGEQLRAAINELAEVRIEYLCSRPGVSLDEVERTARALLDAIAIELPDVAQEATSTARAAGLAPWTLVCAGAVSDVADLLDQRGRGASRPVSECTLTSWNGVGGPVLVGTWDTHLGAARSAVLCRRRPTDGLETLALTTPGWPMQQGVTQAGIGFAIANLVATTVADGVPYIAALPSILSRSSLTSCVDLAAAIPHASARFYLLAGAAGVRGVEVVPRRPISVDESVAQAHTNHMLSNDLRAFEGRSLIGSTTESRLSQATTWMERSSAIEPRDLLLEIGASLIVQKGSDAASDATGLAFAIDPVARSIWYLTMDALAQPNDLSPAVSSIDSIST